MSKIGNSICGGAAPEEAVGTSYFDQGDILSKWGFDGNHCYHCGIKNSELSGLLMQCGKCKKAYYCGMKCFNADLPEHSKWCGTQQIASQPKKGKSEPDPGLRNIVKCPTEVKFHVDAMPEEKKSTKKKVVKEDDKKKKKEKKEKKKKIEKIEEPAPVEETPVEEPPVEEPPVEEVPVVEPPVEVDPVPPDEEQVIEVDSDDEASEHDDDDKRLKFGGRGQVPERTKSVEEIVNLRPTQRNSPERSKSAEMEVVDLSHVEIERREREKYTPDWIAKSPLRRTKNGNVIKTVGDVRTDGVSPSIEINKKTIEFQKPEWAVKRLLKKTEVGDKLKQGIDVRTTARKQDIDDIPHLG